MNLNKSSPTPFILALLCLLLPFINISVPFFGELIEATGLDLITGIEDNGYTIMEPDEFIVVMALTTLVGLILSFLGLTHLTIAAGGAGLLFIFIFVLNLEADLQEEFVEDVININYLVGIYLTGFFLLLGIVLNALVLGQHTSPKPQMEQQQAAIQHNQNDSFSPPQNQVYSPSVKIPTPMLVGLKGYFQGSRITIGSEGIILGREPQLAHLVYPQNYEDISRKHCVISYDEHLRQFYLEDMSTNGTFLYSGKRLTTGKGYYLSPGEKFYLVNLEEIFEVKLE